MSKPLFVRPLTAEERQQLQSGRKSKDRFTLRRAQVLLASAEGQKPQSIARILGCSDQTVRNTIRAFDRQGLDGLVKQTNAPKHDPKLLPADQYERLRELLHQSPRTFGKVQSVWTLDLLAEVCQEKGLTTQRISKHVMRLSVLRLGANWKRAKNWINSPDPAYARKKSDGRL